MQERMKSVTPGKAGSPMPKKPKRSTQATMAMSITFLMPNLFIANGMRRMQSVSETCPMEISTLALAAPQEPANRGLSLNEVMKVLA